MLPDFPDVEMPYPLMNICSGGEHFQFLCTEIVPEFRTPDAEQPTDFYCKFGVVYEGRGISAQFGCDITAGNVYAFYWALDDAYDGLDTNRTAQLVNYGTLSRTVLTVSFGARGQCDLNGHFLNAESMYQSGIEIHMQLDQSYLLESLCAMKRFFDALSERQGHHNFY